MIQITISIIKRNISIMLIKLKTNPQQVQEHKNIIQIQVHNIKLISVSLIFHRKRIK